MTQLQMDNVHVHLAANQKALPIWSAQDKYSPICIGRWHMDNRNTCAK